MPEWEDRYYAALASDSLTMEIVEGCILGRGAHIATRDHMEVMSMFEDSTSDLGDGLEKISRELTNIGVGGDFRVLNWVVGEALTYAADARLCATRKKAELFVERARTLLCFAETEIETQFGAKNSLSELWNVVNAELPDYGYLLDSDSDGLD